MSSKHKKHKQTFPWNGQSRENRPFQQKQNILPLDPLEESLTPTYYYIPKTPLKTRGFWVEVLGSGEGVGVAEQLLGYYNVSDIQYPWYFKY